MAFCSQCGAQLESGANFCPMCGTPVNAPSGAQDQVHQQRPNGSAREQVEAAFEKFKSTAEDHTQQFTPEDIEQNKAMAILSYLGILVLMPIFAAKDSRFARFHANQGLVLLITLAAYGVLEHILNRVFYAIWWGLGSIFSVVLSLAYLVFLVYIVLGIVNAAKGEAKELPIIGKITILH